MAVTEEVMEIVSILDAEGFGVLAGELLAELSAGREISTEGMLKGDGADEIDLPPRAIPDDEQLGEALTILRLRLVEPARHLAEAEDIAARLTDHKDLAIRFVDAAGREDPAIANRAPAGERKQADALAEILVRIANTPPTARI
jgi:hypothetical protein